MSGKNPEYQWYNEQEWTAELLDGLSWQLSDEYLNELSEKVDNFGRLTPEKTKNFEKFTVNTKDLKGTPFLWDKRMIEPTYGNLLWYSQTEYIMRQLNKKNGVESSDWITGNEVIDVPMVYPELKNEFSENLSALLSKSFPEYKNETTKNMVIVTKCKNGKNALAYYKNWKLKLATYVSIGKLRTKTITGKYQLTPDQIRRRSKKYKRSPMPYSMLIDWWFFLHQWWSNWNPQSHWCVRVPGLYQKWIYENVPSWTTIVLGWLY